MKETNLKFKMANNNINTAIFVALKVSEVSRVPILIMSSPGLGKSSTVELFAKVRGYEVECLRGNSTSAEEILGYDTAGELAERNKQCTHLRPSWLSRVLRNEEEGKKTLLFLDEITTANEYVQAALLQLIFSRKADEDYLPDDCLIVAAGNYFSNLSSSFNILPPVMNRFMIFNIMPEVDDLNVFLNKFEGSLVNGGKRRDYFVELEGLMQELDKQEMKISEEKFNKIGEYIERGIRDTARMLMTKGILDMTVTDLQGIYSDVAEDEKLYGFATFRTLNYLRDVTLAFYVCFGKAGLLSDNYKNAIDGLCGIGLHRQEKENRTNDMVEVVRISKYFYDSIALVANDIEKMDNDKLPEYIDFFNEVLKTAASNGKVFGVPEIQAITNKFGELMVDKDLKTVDRPIPSDMLVSMCSMLKNTLDPISQVKCDTGSGLKRKLLDIYPLEKVMGMMSLWNYAVGMYEAISKLVASGSGKRYTDEDIANIGQNKTWMETITFKLRSIRKIIITESPAVGNTMPEIKSVRK